MFKLILLFGLGILILLFSTQKLVRLAEKISKIFRISPLVVGITIMAIGTSLPEFVVSIVSILRQDLGLALGNIVGSNIVNILLVFPLALFFGHLRIGTTKTQKNAWWLLFLTFFFIGLQFINMEQKIMGTILIGLALVITFLEYRLAVFGRDHEDAKQLQKLTKNKHDNWLVLKVLGLILGVIIGGLLTVATVEELALLTGISTTVFGLTLTAIATSLPELISTVFIQEDHQDKMALGNILGSNIYNLALVAGTVMFFGERMTIPIFDWFLLGLITSGFVGILIFYKGKTPPLWIGVVALLFFGVYLYLQIYS